MIFCTLFLKTENVHLMKDVGQLPYSLKEDFGYNAYIATYKNGEYPYLKHEVKGLELQFVKKSIWGKYFDGIRYIYINRKKIDVLNVYHLNLSSFLWIFFFKAVCKKNAIVYLKLDADHFEIEKMQKKNPVAFVKHFIIRNADIVSAESTVMKEALQKYCRTEILYIPNGYTKEQYVKQGIDHKENIILTVGRLGTYQKATQLLVEAFLKAEIVPEWKLVLIGTMTEEFEIWIAHKLSEYPDIGNNVFMPGNIENKMILQEWYSKAKIFVLPSRYEGFPLVLIEALLAGCYIIISDAVLPAEDLIRSPQIGHVVARGSKEELRKALGAAAKMNIEWESNAYKIRSSVENRYLWSTILEPLNRRIISLVRNSDG